MNLKILPSLVNATRLVRGGKLMEATAVIQSALRGDLAHRAPEPENGEADPIEGFCRVLDEPRERPRERPDRGQFITRKLSRSPGAGTGASRRVAMMIVG